jgi:hypothetical protein
LDAPTCELVKMLPGPMTTQAVINPGPIADNQPHPRGLEIESL